MPIIKEVAKPCLHTGKPNPKDYGAGTIWECDNPKCRQRFILENPMSYRDGSDPYWTVYHQSKVPFYKMPGDD